MFAYYSPTGPGLPLLFNLNSDGTWRDKKHPQQSGVPSIDASPDSCVEIVG